MKTNKIVIRGAREHNLKNINLEIPRDNLIVFTGLSGSGKSSLAFDTIYADGQRRYVESLSAYARQFLGQMSKPDVDSIEGLSPAISIDQKTTNKNPRSTVGTITEIYDYLRLLYARIGIPHCPKCGIEISQQTVDQIVDSILNLPEGTKIQILAPIVRNRKGEHVKEILSAKKSGFVRVRIDNIVYDISEEFKIDKNKKHNIEIIVDRLVIKSDIRSRVSDSIETALPLGNGIVIVSVIDGEDLMFSQNYSCPEHSTSIPELTPRMFSFNNPMGACENCNGLGFVNYIDPNEIIPNKSLSLNQGAINVSGWGSMESNTITNMYLSALSKHYKFSLDVPVGDLDESIINIILYGNEGKALEMNHKSGTYKSAFEGIINNLDRRYKETQSDAMREEISKLMVSETCKKCKGQRLKEIILFITIDNINISQFSKMSIKESINFVEKLKFDEKVKHIADGIIKEIKSRLYFLKNVGLGYLNLLRPASTLSGGESQRIRLATQIGSSLVGVLYILDEPSIGLHQRDNDKLILTMKNLRDLGNTVIVVEHDEDTMEASDYIVDIGPGAGVHGGEIICTGKIDDIKSCDKSQTGLYLSGKKYIPVPEIRRSGNGKFLKIIGASENNLKNISVSLPLGKLICVTGVSGSGKSTLINQILYKELSSRLNRSKVKSGKHKDILGIENIDKVIAIDQSPIGRTPRSNPATYTGMFSDIRELFAQTKDSKQKGYKSGRFSFNIKGGRCEACQGDGILKIEMHFLPDVYVMCDTCKGQRYNRETLEINYKDKNIYDVLEMTIEEGCEFFKNIPKIYKKLSVLNDVGLGYVKLGQSASTLSGGESQRVKLASELAKRSTGKTFYILDEPTTGLHIADVDNLIRVMYKLMESGNTVLVIEHNLEVIKCADHIIDIGPEGGDEGGQVVAEGTPEEIILFNDSYTGVYLKRILEK